MDIVAIGMVVTSAVAVVEMTRGVAMSDLYVRRPGNPVTFKALKESYRKATQEEIRSQITIDYAEAWKKLQGRDELRDAGRLPHSPRETELAVRAIITAALGDTDE